MKCLYLIIITSLLSCIACTNDAASQHKDVVPKHENFMLHAPQIGEERTINVWLPETYGTTTDSFPVIYMADGGIAEDFPHIANTIAKLIQEKKIPPVILVGIENTQRRRDLTGFTEVEKDKEIAPVVGGSEKFRAFIKETLFAEIANKYRTTGQKTILGESAAGLFVMETFFLVPDMFDNYIAFDPSLWWNNHYLARTASAHLSNFTSTPKRIWFTSSKAKDVNVYTQSIANTFKSLAIPSIKWSYTPAPKETHATIFRATKEAALIWTFNK